METLAREEEEEKKRYFSELLGGPQFSETRGNPALKGRHASLDMGHKSGTPGCGACGRRLSRPSPIELDHEERFYQLAECITMMRKNRNDKPRPAGARGWVANLYQRLINHQSCAILFQSKSTYSNIKQFHKIA